MNFFRPSSHQSRAMPSGWLMVMALLTLMVMLMPGMAHAADLFTVPAGDKSKTLFLDKIFGDFSNSPLAGPVTVFNSAVLFVGGILAAYTIVAGTMSTAHDGEMLGKKWSSMWIPIRTAVGTAMVLPVLNGFCVAQSIVLWLATQGVGLADAVWNQFASNPLQSMTATSAGMGSKIGTLALGMLTSNVCLQSEQQHNADQQAANTYSFQSISYAITPISGSNTVGYQYGMDSGSAADGNTGATALCGSVTINTSLQTDVASTGISSVDDLSSQIAAKSTTIAQAHQSAMGVMQSSMSSAAASYLANPNSFDVLGAVQNAATAYQTSVSTVANAALNDSSMLTAFRTDVQTDGWAYAGAWYMKLIRMQDAVNGAINRTPSISAPSGEAIMSTDVQADLTRLSNVIMRDAPKYSSGLAQAAAMDMGQNVSTDDCSGLSCIGQYMKKWGKALSTAKAAATNPESLISGSMGSLLDTTTDLNDSSKNGLLAAKGLGDNIIAAGWAVAVIGGILAASIAGIGAALIPLSFAFMLWSVGAGLSVVLPMTPFIMWIGIMIGWLILVVEAVFAAPLWAIVHLHPDGDGVVGRGGTGYMLVLSLTLRPSLMILGLISAIVLMDPITYFLNTTFFGAFRLMQGNTTTGAVTFIAVTSMYCSAMFMVIKKTFSLIHVIPDQIMNWIGNGGPALGGSATEAAEKASHGHTAIISGISNAAGAGSSGFSRIRQIQGQNETIAETRRGTAAQQQANKQANLDRSMDLFDDAASSSLKAKSTPEGARRDAAMELASVKYQRAMQHAVSTGTDTNEQVAGRFAQGEAFLKEAGSRGPGSSSSSADATNLQEARKMSQPAPLKPDSSASDEILGEGDQS